MFKAKFRDDFLSFARHLIDTTVPNLWLFIQPSAQIVLQIQKADSDSWSSSSRITHGIARQAKIDSCYI